MSEFTSLLTFKFWYYVLSCSTVVSGTRNSLSGLVPNRSPRQQTLHVCIAPSSTEQLAVLLLIRLLVLENVLEVLCVGVAH